MTRITTVNGVAVVIDENSTLDDPGITAVSVSPAFRRPLHSAVMPHGHVLLPFTD